MEYQNFDLFTLIEIAIAFVPVLLFLLFMKLMDSFKLVRFRQTFVAIGAGAASAVAAMFLNYHILSLSELSFAAFSRFVVPFTEEAVKILFVVYLVRAKKVGFMVDAAILGFAAGAGFAIIENIYYFNVLDQAGLITWFVRGFGTAVMHGGATAIAAMISKDLADHRSWPGFTEFMPGLAAACVIHALFNMFLLPPVNATLLIVVTLPPVIYLVFKKSEQNTREWLGTGLDSDMEMLNMLLAGNISETRIGQYLNSIREKFPPEAVGDMICYLRLYLELSIKAKGVLIMKESGIDLPADPEVAAQFDELDYLWKSIGRTGILAIQPLMNWNNADLWQLNMLQRDHGRS